MVAATLERGAKNMDHLALSPLTHMLMIVALGVAGFYLMYKFAR
jgi:hypothetical protein